MATIGCEFGPGGRSLRALPRLGDSPRGRVHIIRRLAAQLRGNSGVPRWEASEGAFGVIDLIGNGLVVAMVAVLAWAMVVLIKAASDPTLPPGMPRAQAYLPALALALVATGIALLAMLLAAVTGR
jgi:hypothetical protein